MRHNEGILTRVFPAFAEVVSTRGFRISKSFYDEAAFGNAAVFASSNEFQLRLTRDRGEIAAAVAPLNGTTWYPVQDVVAFMEGRKPDYREIEVKDLVRALDDNYQTITRVLANSGWLSQLELAEQEKEAAFLSRFAAKTDGETSC